MSAVHFLAYRSVPDQLSADILLFLKPHILAVTITAIISGYDLLLPKEARANEIAYQQFNTDFLLTKEGQSVDISRFEKGDSINPGNNRFDVFVNQNLIGRHDVTVNKDEDAHITYCFNSQQVKMLGIDINKLPDINAVANILKNEKCIDIERLVPGSKVDFDQTSLRIDLSIPQAYLSQIERNYVSPLDTDRGITAFFADYNINSWRSRSSGVEQTQHYAGLNTGLNLVGWRLRHNGSYSQSSGDNTEATRQYASLSTYAQKEIAILKSQLTIGQYFTPSDLFESVPYNGIQLASDDRMLPDSQRGFAPVIRGTAETNAKVTVRQNGNTLYEKTVAPGPFEINDLYSSGFAGDVEVTVTEADGRVRSFTVPFATVPQLLRHGVSRYSAVIGTLRDNRLDNAPNFLQGNYQRGISNLWTGYTGSILANDYMAVQVGVALSTGLGAFALDVTHSDASGLSLSQGLGEKSRGQSYRLSYSKLLESTQTNVAVAAYRFSSKGYLSFTDYAQSLDEVGDNIATYRQRSRLQVNISQTMGEGFGSFYLSGAAQNYWGAGRGSDISYQAGYTNSFNWGSINLSVGRTRSSNGEQETQYMLGISLPLGSSPQAPYLNTSVTRSQSGNMNSQLGVSGSLGNQSQFSYGLYGSYNQSSSNSSTHNLGGNVQYRASNALLSSNISSGNNFNQYGVGMRGSVLVHAGGINFSQGQGETKAIIVAKGAKGASLLNSSGEKIAGNGYAVVSGLMPYRENSLAIDPKGMSNNVELATTEQRIAPSYGAIVKLDYPTVTGRPVLLLLQDTKGNSLPVGAEVNDSEGNLLTMVGQGSRVFLRAEKSQGQLVVRWGESIDRQCKVDYQLPEVADNNPTSLLQQSALCYPVSSSR
ncbi:fimbria/pilus outer membrane usher protein [Serratia oryzae]|uniref:fimbria/pilus outer membrane usher protein n=1 Tax=Serratia oryzae TaxID=2034155 RepID=UPI0009F8347F|nr:fimbria/pilus outer membrane usher protein [Serratia oryzae]